MEEERWGRMGCGRVRGVLSSLAGAAVAMGETECASVGERARSARVGGGVDGVGRSPPRLMRCCVRGLCVERGEGKRKERGGERRWAELS
jgi:hypothetical protein